MKKTPFLVFTLLFFTNSLQAQSAIWAKAFIGKPYIGKGENAAGADAITVTNNGYLYTTGWYSDSVDFDPSNGTLFLERPGGAYLSKLDTNGKLVWVKSIRAVLADSISGARGYAIKLDKAGNIYLTGSFSGTVDFDPGAAEYNLTSAGASDFFILKINQDGAFSWARRVGGKNTDEARAIVQDKENNIYVSGRFRDTVDFNPGTATTNLIAVGLESIFLTKFTEKGEFMWARQIDGVDNRLHNYVKTSSLAIDSTNYIYWGGMFKDTLDCDPGPGVVNLIALGSTIDLFIVKLTKDGGLIWGQAINGQGNETLSDIAIDRKQNMYITGTFSGTADFDPGPPNFPLGSGGSANAFVTKWNSFGNFIWAKSFRGSAYSAIYALALDNNDGVYTTGEFSEWVDFDPGSGTQELTASGYDVFINKLDESGNFKWVRQFSGPSNLDEGHGIAFNNENVYTTGIFEKTVDFDPEAGVYNLDGSNLRNAFIHKLSANKKTCNLGAKVTTLTHVKCKGGATGQITILAEKGTEPYLYRWATTPVQDSSTATQLSAGTYTCYITDDRLCYDTITATITEPLTGISSSVVTQTPSKCSKDHTGSALVNGTGGTGTLSYSWNTNPKQTSAYATQLNAQKYICTISDAQCSVQQEVSITATTPFVTYVSEQINEPCKGDSLGSATISVDSAGATPYVHLWNTQPPQTTATISNLPAGTYVCNSVDPVSGCTSTDSVTITEPALLAPIITSKSNAICQNNGSMTAMGKGGTAPYSYSWNSSPVQSTATATALAAGSYSCTVIDSNGCTATTAPTKIIEEPGFATNQSIAICGGETYTVGTNTYTQSGTYTDKLLSVGGCDSLVTTTLTVIELDSTVIITPTTLTANENRGSYQWINCGTSSPVPGATERSFSPNASGSYRVLISTGNCMASSSCYPFNNGTSLSEQQQAAFFLVYPNPSTGVFTITTPIAGNYVIVDELGRSVKRIDLTGMGNEHIDLSALENGVYYIRGLETRLLPHKIILIK